MKVSKRRVREWVCTKEKEEWERGDGSGREWEVGRGVGGGGWRGVIQGMSSLKTEKIKDTKNKKCGTR